MTLINHWTHKVAALESELHYLPASFTIGMMPSIATIRESIEGACVSREKWKQQ